MILDLIEVTISIAAIYKSCFPIIYSFSLKNINISINNTTSYVSK